MCCRAFFVSVRKQTMYTFRGICNRTAEVKAAMSFLNTIQIISKQLLNNV